MGGGGGSDMKKTLGLDLGTNSLGWAVLDDTTGDFSKKESLCSPKASMPPATHWKLRPPYAALHAWHDE